MKVIINNNFIISNTQPSLNILKVLGVNYEYLGHFLKILEQEIKVDENQLGDFYRFILKGADISNSNIFYDSENSEVCINFY
jgi:hypothetical protein